MLVFVGLGLYDELDVSIRGLRAIKTADLLFAEFYTSTLPGTTVEKLENFYGKKVHILAREDVENNYDYILNAAKEKNVVFLCAGDSMVATTHAFLRTEALKRGIETRIIHGASVYTGAPSILGLHIYKFGKVVSIPKPEKNFFPTSPYYGILENFERGLHTLILLDIKADIGYMMSAKEGMNVLIEMEAREKRGLITPETKMCVVARVGSPDCITAYGEIAKLVETDFGMPPHTLVLPGKLHFVEEEALNLVRV
ncbi:MAG: diphthine synthase [Thermoplasmata archaeon]